MSKPNSKNKTARPPATASSPGLAGWLKHPPGGALLLAAMAVITYLPALLHGGFIWDDDDYVTQNLTLRSLDGLRRIWFEVGVVPQYYPLVHTTFWVEYHLWGLSPFGFHLVNVLLHSLAAIFLWRVLLKLELPGAWLAAAIFAVHPVNVESVAWITERKNVLSAVFYFGAALAWLRWRENRELKKRKAETGGRCPSSPWKYYIVALGLFVCAMLSKTVACSFPAALLLVAWWKQGRLRAREVWPTLPFFVIGVGMGWLTAWIEKHHVGAAGADWSLTLAHRCLIAGRALWFYAGKLVWPADLTFIYPRWEVSPMVWWQWIFPITAAGVVAALWFMRNRMGRGPLVAVLFFGGTLFPALGFINTYPMRYSFVADHFQYLAGVGLITWFAVGLRRWPAVAGAVLLGLGVLTWRQTYIYHDQETLWRNTIARNPDCWMAHNNLGLILKQQGNIAAAEAEYHASLAARPDYEEALNNLAVLQSDTGRAGEAIKLLREVLRAHPDHIQLIHNLGYALAAEGQYAAAMDCYQTVLRMRPQSGKTHFALGVVLADLGRVDEAVGEYQLALQYNPADADAHNNLGIVLAQQGKIREATEHFRAAVQANPDQVIAHNSLGNVLLLQQQLPAAVTEFETALRLKPDYAEAHNGLGYTLAGLGRWSEAESHYQEALRLNPGYPAAQYNLGCALVHLGRRDDAIAHLQEALRLKPDYEEARQKLDELKPSAPK